MKSPVAKKVTRRRTLNEVKKDRELQKKFDEGFAMAFILLCQNEVENASAQEIMEMRSFQTMHEAGYELPDFAECPLDPADREILNNIFSV